MWPSAGLRGLWTCADDRLERTRKPWKTGPLYLSLQPVLSLRHCSWPPGVYYGGTTVDERIGLVLSGEVADLRIQVFCIYYVS